MTLFSSKFINSNFSSISLPRFRVSLSSYFSWSSKHTRLCAQSSRLQTFSTSRFLQQLSTSTRPTSAYTTARKPFPFIPIMSDSEDDKPLIKGESMQLPVQLFALQFCLLKDSPHFDIIPLLLITFLSPFTYLQHLQFTSAAPFTSSTCVLFLFSSVTSPSHFEVYSSTLVLLHLFSSGSYHLHLDQPDPTNASRWTTPTPAWAS